MLNIARATIFSPDIIDDRPGIIVLEISGKNVRKLFRGESGGHRWQRVPPTEKRGRTHTSTITVAVMIPAPENSINILDRDIEWKAVRGSGKGGQAKQKTSNAVQMKHIPSGIQVRVESDRSQTVNRDSARRLLEAKLSQSITEKSEAIEANKRRNQLGSGQRGDKIRTIRLQDDSVIDHNTNKKIKASKYLRGYVDELH